MLVFGEHSVVSQQITPNSSRETSGPKRPLTCCFWGRIKALPCIVVVTGQLVRTVTSSLVSGTLHLRPDDVNTHIFCHKQTDVDCQVPPAAALLTTRVADRFLALIVTYFARNGQCMSCVES